MIRPNPSGWTVAIEHPDTGAIHTPEVTGSPSRQPTANALPTTEIPVENDDKWLHTDWERGAPMRVWVDGERQPLDWLEDVSHSEGETTLSSEGGHELKTRCQRDTGIRATHALAGELIRSLTDYDVEITAPPANRENGVVIGDWSGADRLAERCPGVADPREPITRTDDGQGLETQQVAYPKDPIVDQVEGAPAANQAAGDAFSSGFAAGLADPGDRLRVTFTPDHDIPASDVGIALRDRATSYSDVRYTWAGTKIDEQHNAANALQWRGMGQGRAYSPGMGYAAAVGSALKAGQEYQFDIEVLEGGAGYQVDLVALWDRRFGPELGFPNPGSENNGDTLAGPQHYPSSYRARFSAAEPIRSVVGARAVVDGRMGGTADDDAEQNTTRLSINGGNGYLTGTGNDVGFDFGGSPPGPSVSAIVALGRRGEDAGRFTPPVAGFEPQRIEGLRLEADLADTPITVNRSFDGQLHEVLATLAAESDSIWEYRRPGDGGTVVWTQPGRSPVPSQRAPEAASFSLEKAVGTTVARAVVYGSTREVTGERIAADHGTAQSLVHDRLQQGSVSVTETREGASYRSGDDYTVGHEDGTITTTPDGRIADGAALSVSYSYQTRGEYHSPVDGPTETAVEDISGLNSNYAANQAARIIVTESQRDLLSGSLTIPARDTGFSVVEYLRPEDLPIGQGGRTGATQGLSALHIRSITTEPTQTALQLGTRRSVSEIVGDISNRVSSVSRQA